MRERLPWRIDSPDTGEVATKCQKGSAPPLGGEGWPSCRVIAFTLHVSAKVATPQAASRPPLTRPGSSVAARHLPALRGVTPQGEPLQVAAFSAVTIYLSLYLIPRPCATVSERKRLLFAVFWVAWRWKAESTFAVTRYYPIPCNCKSASRFPPPGHPKHDKK